MLQYEFYMLICILEKRALEKNYHPKLMCGFDLVYDRIQSVLFSVVHLLCTSSMRAAKKSVKKLCSVLK